MKTTYSYDHFYLHEEITAILKKYAAEHPELCRLYSLNQTPEGREIWAMDVTNTMVLALGGLTKQITSLVIFYPTPDFTDETQCTEEYLIAHQTNPPEMTLEEWTKFYVQFCQLYATQQYQK